MKIAFIGTGIMGAPMVRNLLKAGHSVTVFNRTIEKAEALKDDGAHVALTCLEASSTAEVLITMLSAPEAVYDASLSKEGFLNTLNDGATWIDCSTVNPSFSKVMAVEAQRRGVKFIDAPVAGSLKPAQKGELVFLAGGDKEHIDKAQELFDAMGSRLIHCGVVGTGSAMKMCVNTMLATVMAGFSEALTLGEDTGIERDTLYDALSSLAVSAPILKMKKDSMKVNSFPTEFPLKWMHKDLQLVSQTAYEHKTAMPSTNAVKEIFGTAERCGFGDEDFSAILKVINYKKDCSK